MLDEHSTKPGDKCARFTQLRQMQPCIHERFLRRVLGQLHVADTDETGGEGHVLERLDDFAEGSTVTRTGGVDEGGQRLHGQ